MPALVSDPDRAGRPALQAVDIALNDAEVAALEAGVLCCLPDTDFNPYFWFVDGDAPQFAYLAVSASDGSVELAIGFRALEDRRWEIHAAYLAFADKWQRRGHADTLARSLIAIGLRHKASRIITLANIDVGSYAWARRMARPLELVTVKRTLLDRIRRLEAAGLWEAPLPEQARRIVNSDDSDFMFALSRLAAPQGEADRMPGFELLAEGLLQSWSWYAVWDLTDTDYMKRVSRLLTG